MESEYRRSDLEMYLDSYFDEAFMHPSMVKRFVESGQLRLDYSDDSSDPVILFNYKGFYPLVEFLYGKKRYIHLYEDFEGLGARNVFIEVVPNKEYVPLLSTKEGTKFYCDFIIMNIEED